MEVDLAGEERAEEEVAERFREGLGFGGVDVDLAVEARVMRLGGEGVLGVV